MGSIVYMYKICLNIYLRVYTEVNTTWVYISYQTKTDMHAYINFIYLRSVYERSRSSRVGTHP